MAPDSDRAPVPDLVRDSPPMTPVRVKTIVFATSIEPPDAPRVTPRVDAVEKVADARRVPPLIVTPALTPPKFLSVEIDTLPAVMVVDPLYVFSELLNVSVPVPFFESEPPAPEMRPAYVVEESSPPLVNEPDPRVSAPVPDEAIDPTSSV